MHFDYYLQSAFLAFLGEKRVPLNTMAEVASVQTGDRVSVQDMRDRIIQSALFTVDGEWVSERDR